MSKTVKTNEEEGREGEKAAVIMHLAVTYQSALDTAWPLSQQGFLNSKPLTSRKAARLSSKRLYA